VGIKPHRRFLPSDLTMRELILRGDEILRLGMLDRKHRDGPAVVAVIRPTTTFLLLAYLGTAQCQGATWVRSRGSFDLGQWCALARPPAPLHDPRDAGNPVNRVEARVTVSVNEGFG
jgi:hypothetical protein